MGKRKKSLVEFLNEAFKNHQDELAIIDRTDKITYGVLASTIKSRGRFFQDLANQNNLICHENDEPFGLIFNNTYELIVSILGCISKRIPFIILDPHLPSERFAFMLKDSGLKICATDLSKYATRSKTGISFCIVNSSDKIVNLEKDELIFEPHNLEDISYMIYTSGSTGKPKGIKHTWGEIDNNIMFMVEEYTAMEPTKNVLQLIPFYSDPSIRQLLWPLATGASITIVPPNSRSEIDKWVDLMVANKTTDIFIVPNLLKCFVSYIEQEKWKAKQVQNNIILERVFSVGEPLHEVLADSLVTLFPAVSLYNQYGISEITGNLTSYKYQKQGKKEDDSISSFVAIGKILPHVEHYVMDVNLNPLVKEGDIGVLVVRVENMLGSYNNSVDSNKFIKLQGKNNMPEIFFYTGDQVKIAKENVLLFAGRLDNQIKILGHRVELLEIESVICSYENIEKCAVIVKLVSENPVLVAYYTSKSDLVEVELRKYITKFLTPHMLPGKFIALPDFPQLPNGKVNRVFLEQLSIPSRDAQERSEFSTENAITYAILEVYKRVFKNTEIYAESNFFELGGNSLLVFQSAALLSLEFGSHISGNSILKYPVVADLSQALHSMHDFEDKSFNNESDANTNLKERMQKFPLLPLQRAYVFGQSQSSVPIHDYLELACSRLNIEKLEESFNRVIARHSMLRCVIVESEFQRVLKNVPKYIFHINNMAQCSDEKIRSQLLSIRSEMSHQIFDLTKFPCFQIRVSRTNSSDILHLSFNGLFIDASSFEIILNDWSIFYRNPLLEIEPLEFSFSQYIDEINSKRNDLCISNEKYWVDRLENFPEGPDLPLATACTKLEAKFTREVKAVPLENWRKIQCLASEKKLWSSSILLTAFADVISKYTSSKHFALNITLNNRIPINSMVSEIVGNFTSTSLLEFSETHFDVSFENRARLTEQRLAADLDHSMFSGVEFQRRLITKRDKFEELVYPIVLTNLLDINRDYKKYFDGEYIATNFHTTQTPQVWIDYKVYEDQRGLVIEWDYLQGIFPDGLVAEMHDLYVSTIFGLSQCGIELLPDQLLPKGLTEMVRNVNDTFYDFHYCSLHELFFEKAAMQKEAPAVITPSRTLSYGELQQMVSFLSEHLIERGIRRNDFVGVLLEKGFEQIVATLAIMSSGAAYVPIDTSWPKSRMLSILLQCKISIILTSSDLCSQKGLGTNEVEFVPIDYLLENMSSSQNPFNYIKPNLDEVAYVIFTSGTTRIPKGVAISHKSAVNTILDMNRRCKITQNDRVLGLSELHFDLSVYDIFGILGAGGCLVLPDCADKKEPAAWIQLMINKRVTLWNTVPALLQMLTDFLVLNKQESSFLFLRWVWLSGDRIPLALPNAIRNFAKCKVLSLGGATEAAIWSISYEINEVSPQWKTIPYGLPLLNQKMYVLDSKLNLCPVWVKGELFISGTGLALGYWGDKDKTESSFFSHPITGERLYRTGDYGKYLPDGCIEFLGREDDQIKFNGYRIELGEIQSVLVKHYLVADAKVSIVSSEGTSHIAASIIANEVSIIDNDIESIYSFKMSQPGLRKDLNLHKGISLEPRTQSKHKYISRKSYRSFSSKAVTLSEVAKLICSMQQQNGLPFLQNLTVESIGSLLHPLSQLRNSNFELPKYMYASAGNLYPIQVYLEIGECLDGLVSGYYYYDPLEHQLFLIRQSTFDHYTVKLFLVGVYSAIHPVYKDLSESLMWLNAGYLLGALPSSINANVSHGRI